MEASQIRSLKMMLTHYLRHFDERFARCATSSHLPVYVKERLSDLSAKSCESIALAGGVAKTE